jgi:hypothetical protein
MSSDEWWSNPPWSAAYTSKSLIGHHCEQAGVIAPVHDLQPIRPQNINVLPAAPLSNVIFEIIESCGLGEMRLILAANQDSPHAHPAPRNFILNGCKLHSRRKKRRALCIARKSQVGLRKPCVKRVTVPPWFHPNRPMSLLAQLLSGFRFEHL